MCSSITQVTFKYTWWQYQKAESSTQPNMFEEFAERSSNCPEIRANKWISALCGIGLKHSWPGPPSTSTFLLAEADWFWGYQVRHILSTPADIAGMPRHAPNKSSSSINTYHNLNNCHSVCCAVTRRRVKTTIRLKSFQTNPNLTYGVQSAMMLRVHQLGFQRIRFTQTRVFVLMTGMNTVFRLKPWHGGYIMDETDKTRWCDRQKRL